MKRAKQLFIVLMLVSIFSFTVNISATIIKDKTQNNETSNVQVKLVSENTESFQSYAEITIFVYEGEGCACEPLFEVDIWAYGMDIGHNDTNLTDEEGMCILRLEYNFNYRVTFEKEGFQTVKFDFLVLDDQTFVFHLQEEESIPITKNAIIHKVLSRLKSRIPLNLLNPNQFQAFL